MRECFSQMTCWRKKVPVVSADGSNNNYSNSLKSKGCRKDTKWLFDDPMDLACKMQFCSIPHTALACHDPGGKVIILWSVVRSSTPAVNVLGQDTEVLIAPKDKAIRGVWVHSMCKCAHACENGWIYCIVKDFEDSGRLEKCYTTECPFTLEHFRNRASSMPNFVDFFRLCLFCKIICLIFVLPSMESNLCC